MPSSWKQIIPSRSQYDKWGFRERRLDTGFLHLRIGFSADPLKDDDWARRHALKYGGFDAPKWRREQGIDYKAYGGQRIWPMLDEKIHNAQIDISNWTLFRVIDQGIRHPTVCLWVAVNAKGDRHIYREYYSTNRSIAMNCRAILSLTGEEPIAMNYIDPSTRKRNVETLKTTIQVYEENGLYCEPADNSFVGYDTVGNAALSTLARYALRTQTLPFYFTELQPNQDQLLVLADKPTLTFDTRFTPRCFSECCNHRWQDTKGDETQKAPTEKPVDKDDDGPDCVRYAIQSPLFYSRKRPDFFCGKTIDFRKLYQLKLAKRNHDKILERCSNRAYVK